MKPKIFVFKLENELSLPIPLVRTILYCNIGIKALKRKSSEPNFITIFFNFLLYSFITIFIITFSFYVSPFLPFHLFLLICSSLYSLSVTSVISSFITSSSISKYFLFSLSHYLSSLHFLPLLSMTTTSGSSATTPWSVVTSAVVTLTSLKIGARDSRSLISWYSS